MASFVPPRATYILGHPRVIKLCNVFTLRVVCVCVCERDHSAVNEKTWSMNQRLWSVMVSRRPVTMTDIFFSFHFFIAGEYSFKLSIMMSARVKKIESFSFHGVGRWFLVYLGRKNIHMNFFNIFGFKWSERQLDF